MLSQFFDALRAVLAKVEAESDGLVAEHLHGLVTAIIVDLIDRVDFTPGDSTTAEQDDLERVANALRAKVGASAAAVGGGPAPGAGNQADQVAALQAKVDQLSAALAERSAKDSSQGQDEDQRPGGASSFLVPGQQA